MKAGLRDYQRTTLDNRLSKMNPVELRRCLKCDHWMRSVGSYHRLCNACCDYRCVPFKGEGKRVS